MTGRLFIVRCSQEITTMAETEREPAAPERDPADDASRAPWAPPSPEARAEARPAKQALKDALREIKTPEQAAQVADEVIAAAGECARRREGPGHAGGGCEAGGR
jgi:hypothetical protein